eukprot:3592196-Prymnesium_polylepis.1
MFVDGTSYKKRDASVCAPVEAWPGISRDVSGRVCARVIVCVRRFALATGCRVRGWSSESAVIMAPVDL